MKLAAAFAYLEVKLNIAMQLWKLQFLARNSKLFRKIVIEIIVTILKSKI